MMRRTMLPFAAVLLACALAPDRAHAQQPSNSPSATMPAPGLLSLRVMVRYDRLRDDPTGQQREVDAVRQMLHGSYGLAPGLVVFGETAFEREDMDAPGPIGGTRSGLTDSVLGVRYRFLRRDTGPIDTLRMALQAAARLPTGADAFSTDTVTPSVGVNLTMIRGRHGLNATAKYELTTGDTPQRLYPGDALADHLRVSAAHLYRLAPSSYAVSSESAWFTQLELLGHAETNGDASLELAPGLLYEARRWAAEASVLLPIAEDLERRPRRELGLMVGVRLLF